MPLRLLWTKEPLLFRVTRDGVVLGRADALAVRRRLRSARGVPAYRAHVRHAAGLHLLPLLAAYRQSAHGSYCAV